MLLFCSWQKKFQQKHLATVAAIKGNTGSTTSSVVDDQPIPPVRRFGGLQQQQQQPQRRISGGGPVTSSNSRGGSDSVVQVDVKGKVRFLLAVFFITFFHAYFVHFGQIESKITVFVDQRLDLIWIYQNCRLWV